MRKTFWIGTIICGATALAFGACSDDETKGKSAALPDASLAETSTTDAGGGTDSAATDSATTDSQVADVGTDAPVVDAGFTPATLGSRVVLWLEGDSYLVVDGGATWPDKSSAHNDALQDAAARAPSFIDAGLDGSVNGKGVVRFAGNQFLSILDNASLQWAESDFGFYVVMRHVNDGSTKLPDYAIVYGKWTDINPLYPGFFLWANYPGTTRYVARLDTNQLVRSDAGMNDGTVRLVGARRVGTELSLRVGGTEVEKISDASVPDALAFNAPGLPAVIGGRPAATQQLHGDIAEIIAVKGTLSDAEQTQLEAYLKSKYGL